MFREMSFVRSQLPYRVETAAAPSGVILCDRPDRSEKECPSRHESHRYSGRRRVYINSRLTDNGSIKTTLDTYGYLFEGQTIGCLSLNRRWDVRGLRARFLRVDARYHPGRKTQHPASSAPCRGPAEHRDILDDRERCHGAWAAWGRSRIGSVKTTLDTDGHLIEGPRSRR